MKTNRIITMLAVAAAAMACNQAEIESPSVLKANQFMASAPSTKVSMNADFSLYWEAGDQVSVFAPDGSNNLFTSEAETGAKTTVLNGADSFTIDLSQTYYAIYPYSADTSLCLLIYSSSCCISGVFCLLSSGGMTFPRHNSFMMFFMGCASCQHTTILQKGRKVQTFFETISTFFARSFL